MKSAFVSYDGRDPEAQDYVLYLRHHLRFLDVEVIDVSMSLFPGDDIRRSITEAINRCSIFICLLDSNNPNVMFELGYAFAKNKQIVIVSDDFNSIPFDVQNSVFIPRHASPLKLIHQIESKLSDLRAPSWYDELHAGSPESQISLLASRPDILDAIDSHEFTKIVCSWFSFHGCKVFFAEPLGPDSGYDFRVDGFRGRTAAVEIKKYKTSSQVSISVVRQMVGAMLLENIPTGIIVSSAPFTRSAISFAKEIEPEILLWTLEDMATELGITKR